MKLLRQKMIFKLIAMVGLLITFICGSTMYVAYQQEEGLYLDQLKVIQDMVELSMNQHTDEIEVIKEAMVNDPQAYLVDEAAAAMQFQLNELSGHNRIVNAYLFYPEEKMDGSDKLLTVLMGNSEYYEQGMIPLTEYTVPERLDQALSAAKEDQIGLSSQYRDETGTWISTMSSLRNTSGNVVAYLAIDFDYDIIEKELEEKSNIAIIVGLIAGAIGIGVLLLLLNHNLRPVRQLSSLSEQVAQGDLTVSLSTKRQDEIGRLANNFNGMVGNIRQLISQIQESSEQVAESSEKLKEGAAQTEQATHQVAAAIEEIAGGAEIQLKSSEESSVAMEEMAAGIQRIAEASSSAAEASSSAAEEAGQGLQVMEENERHIDSINHNVKQTVAVISKLESLSGEIGRITDAISQISSQTNILALNAAIEAARAGEHGRGFAVVSTQIRKLAEQSQQSSEQIAGLIETIQRETRQAVETMQVGAEEIDAVAGIVGGTGAAFKNIAGSIDHINQQIMEMSASAEQMSAGTEEISASISELAHISRQSSGNSQNVAAASEEQLASMGDISAAAVDLNSMARSLKETVSKFKL